jgi:hypothetical protein
MITRARAGTRVQGVRAAAREGPRAIVLAQFLFGSRSERLYTPRSHFGPKLPVRAEREDRGWNARRCRNYRSLDDQCVTEKSDPR